MINYNIMSFDNNKVNVINTSLWQNYFNLSEENIKKAISCIYDDIINNTRLFKPIEGLFYTDVI